MFNHAPFHGAIDAARPSDPWPRHRSLRPLRASHRAEETAIRMRDPPLRAATQHDAATQQIALTPVKAAIDTIPFALLVAEIKAGRMGQDAARHPQSRRALEDRQRPRDAALDDPGGSATDGSA